MHLRIVCTKGAYCRFPSLTRRCVSRCCFSDLALTPIPSHPPPKMDIAAGVLGTELEKQLQILQTATDPSSQSKTLAIIILLLSRSSSDSHAAAASGAIPLFAQLLASDDRVVQVSVPNQLWLHSTVQHLHSIAGCSAYVISDRSKLGIAISHPLGVCARIRIESRSCTP